MDRTLTPPAIVKTADANLEQLAYLITAALDAGERAGRQTLERYKEAGEALVKAKTVSKHGDWLKWLDTNKIDRRRASEAMRVAVMSSKWAGSAHLTEALRLITDPIDEEREKGKSPKEVTPNSSATFCRACRTGVPNPTCPNKECLSYLATHPSEIIDDVPDFGPKPPREPGDDTDSEQAAKAAEKAKPKVGSVLWDWKPWDQAFGKMAQSIDAFGNAYQVKETPEAETLRKKLSEYRDAFRWWVSSVAKVKSPE
jgi:hypothetical protein